MSEETVQTSTQAKSKGIFGNRKLILLSAVFLIVIIAVIGVIFITANMNPNAAGKTNKFSTSSALEEIDYVFRDGVISVMNSMDFNKLKSSNPISFIDIEKISSETERIAGRLSYLSMSEKAADFKVGDKNHSALDLAFETGSGRTKSTIDLKLDLYSEITSEYDSEEISRIQNELKSLTENNNIEGLKTIVELFADRESLNSMFQGQNMLIEGNVKIGQNNEEVGLVFEAMTIDSKGFFSLKELDLSRANSVPTEQFEQLEEIEGNYYSLDIAEVLSVIFQKLLPQIQDLDYLPTNTTSVGLEESLEQFNVILSQLDEEGIDAVIRTSQPVKNVIADAVNNTVLFKDIKNSEAIRETENTCVSGKLDIKSLVKNLGEAYRKIADIIMSDSSSNISESTKTRMLNEISSQTDLLSLSSGFINISATTCSDSEKRLQGFGLNFDVSVPGQNTSVKVDFLNVSNDFSKDISAPKDSIDGTGSILEMIEQADFGNI